ncbi:MAG: glutamate formimidoyltransferase [Lachnospiraceae bacterium]|nr:glutamate formimidoyltransferase [Lachnospiraceae bacterium]
MSNRLLECVPNYSEGRNMETVEKIADCFRGKTGVRLLDYQTDPDHNRMVITAIGEPEALRDAVISSFGVAIDLIDLTKHEGQHPRMGAVDVVPFIPCRNTTVEDADRTAKEVAKAVGEQYRMPVFLYEDSASAPHRQNLAAIRKGQFEGMAEKLKDTEQWSPDFGPGAPHATAGVVAIGARMPLVAYNVNLDTDNVEIADKIAKRIRHIGGGWRYIKAIGVELSDRKIAQVSMNLTNYQKTAVYQAFETVKMEARRYGVNVLESEVVGLLPMEALVDCAQYYLQLSGDFDPMKQVMENRLLEEE